MRAIEYIEPAIKSAIRRLRQGYRTPFVGIPVYPIRILGERNRTERNAGPDQDRGVADSDVNLAVVWRQDITESRYLQDATMNGPLDAAVVFFEIECRSPENYQSLDLLADPSDPDKETTIVGSRVIADCILDQFNGDERIAYELGRFDELDDASQRRGDYFSHVLVVGLNNEGSGPQDQRVPIASTGPVRVEAELYETLRVSASTGPVRVEAELYETLRVSASTGPVRVEAELYETLRVSASTGPVRVTVGLQ